jgi:hypothetical protein
MNKKTRTVPECKPGRPSTGAVKKPSRPVAPREIGGRQGPEPTRYGDWEKAGKCVDF